MLYKEFYFNNSKYIFCTEDSEVLKISRTSDINDALNDIKFLKEKSNIDLGNKTQLKDIYIKSKINTIGINLTNGCNLSCKYCYISAPNKEKKIMSEEKFVEILNFLKSEIDEKIIFYFAGAGEPTLNFNLLKKIPMLCKENGFDNCGFDLTTNGVLMTQEMIDFYKLNNFEISISLDGNENINNAYRVYSNGKGSFKNVARNINLLKENRIAFSCKTVIQPDNTNLAEVFSFFEENKIHFIFNIATNTFDNNFSPNINDLSNFETQMDNVIENYTYLIKKNHKIYAYKIIDDLKRIHHGITNDVACKGGIDGFFIDIEGNIFTCSYHCSSDDLAIGNITSGIDYDKIIKNQWYAKPVDNYSSCSTCWMKHLCSGSCFAVKWLENENTNEPSEYLCKTYDIYWSAIIKLYTEIQPIIANGSNVNFIDKDYVD